MKAITKQDKINTVAQRWKEQYQDRRNETYKQLCALDNPTEVQIANIIGNKSWTANMCSECEVDALIIVQVGQEPDYNSYTAWLCLPCLQKAVNLAKKYYAT